SIQIKFEVSFGKNVRANITSFHDQVAELNALALLFLPPFTDLRHSGHVRNGSAGLRRSNFLLWIVALNEQANVIINADQRGLPASASLPDGFCVVNINPLLQTMPGEGPIHRAGIDIDIAEGSSELLRTGTLAAGAGPVDGDDNGRIQLRVNRRKVARC